MGTAKEELLDKLRTDRSTHAEVSRMVHNIYYLSQISPSFTTLASNLIDTSHAAERAAVIASLRAWISDDRNVPAAYNSTEKFNNKCGTNYDEARYILEDAIRIASIERISAFADKLPPFLALAYGYHNVSDAIIIRSNHEIRPDLLAASKEQLDRYYHPLVIASHIAKPYEDEERFVSEVPAFIAWAAAQENMAEPLVNALSTKSIVPHTIEDIINLREETNPALHDGLI